MDQKVKQTKILQTSYINTNFTHFLQIIQDRVNHRQNTFVATVNPEIAYFAHQHPKYQQILADADYVTPDGIGILKAANSIGHPIEERITGFDTFKAMLQWGAQNHKSAYLIGAKPEVIDSLRQVLANDYPGLTISGIHDGYFKAVQPLIDDIQAKQPDMVFLALGSPKQEQIINQYRHVSDGLWIGLGGSFDVLAGHTKRAPRFWIDHHLEWLYRLLKEPSRLPRLMAIPKYLRLVKRSNK